MGVLAAAGGVRGLVSTRPEFAIWGVAVDTPVLLGSLGIALATGLVFGFLPGLPAVRGKPADALHGGRSRSVTPARGSWLRRSLVVAQIALCTVLLATVGVFLRTFVGLMSSELGFEPANVLTARASLQGPDYRSRAAVAALYRRTLAVLERLPGVEAAAVASNLPVERGLNLPLRETPGGPIVASIDWRYVTGDYLRVLRIPLVAGRAFSATDHRAAAPPVALVDEEYVRCVGGGRWSARNCRSPSSSSTITRARSSGCWVTCGRAGSPRPGPRCSCRWNRCRTNCSGWPTSSSRRPGRCGRVRIRPTSSRPSNGWSGRPTRGCR